MAHKLTYNKIMASKAAAAYGRMVVYGLLLAEERYAQEQALALQRNNPDGARIWGEQALVAAALRERVFAEHAAAVVLAGGQDANTPGILTPSEASDDGEVDDEQEESEADEDAELVEPAPKAAQHIGRWGMTGLTASDSRSAATTDP